MTHHTPLSKKSFTLDGHRTSVALEPAFWGALERIAEHYGLRLSQYVAQVNAARSGPLASALRVDALLHITEREPCSPAHC